MKTRFCGNHTVLSDSKVTYPDGQGSFVKLSKPLLADSLLPTSCLFIFVKLTLIFFVAHRQEVGRQFTMGIEEGK